MCRHTIPDCRSVKMLIFYRACIVVYLRVYALVVFFYNAIHRVSPAAFLTRFMTASPSLVSIMLSTNMISTPSLSNVKSPSNSLCAVTCGVSDVPNSCICVDILALDDAAARSGLRNGESVLNRSPKVIFCSEVKRESRESSKDGISSIG